MEKKRANRLWIMIAGAAMVLCAVAIVGIRQTAVSRARERQAIPKVTASYQRPSESAAARVPQVLSDGGAKAIPVSAEAVVDDPLRGIPVHKRYTIVGEGYSPIDEVDVPMGVARAEGQ